MAGTISDWIIATNTIGLDLSRLHSDKLQDYERLKQSGLPIFDDFIIPLNQFQRGDKDLETFLSKYGNFVIRAIPNTKTLPRRYKIGVYTFEDCEKFLAEQVQRQDEDRYLVLLTENEPTNCSGVIISRSKDVLIEVAMSGLDELSHGLVTPSGGHFKQHGFNHFRQMKYTTEDVQLRGLMWRALQYLKTDLPSDSDLFPKLDFMKGYFEFVVTEKTNKIKFLDFKVNEAYLK